MFQRAGLYVNEVEEPGFWINYNVTEIQMSGGIYRGVKWTTEVTG